MQNVSHGGDIPLSFVGMNDALAEAATSAIKTTCKLIKRMILCSC